MIQIMPKQKYAEKQLRRLFSEKYDVMSDELIVYELVHRGVAKGTARKIRQILVAKKAICWRRKVFVNGRGRLVKLWELANNAPK